MGIFGLWPPRVSAPEGQGFATLPEDETPLDFIAGKGTHGCGSRPNQ